MIRPVAFGYNAETAVNNAFQHAGIETDVNEQAQREFDYFVTVLQSNGINVIVVSDTPEPHTPDSIFPNNWCSYHSNGNIVLYPMFANNRRKEREKNVIDELKHDFFINDIVNLAGYENEEKYLEGTGSLVLDRENKIAYSCHSPRTHPSVIEDFCERMEYRPVLFSAKDKNSRDIYHTNVMMCIADKFVVICMESIADEKEKKMLREKFMETGKEIIEISAGQMSRFAGNMLQVHNKHGKRFLVMSTQAFKSLTAVQIERLESFNPILHAPLYAIEQNGGGSARCMMAEIFLPVSKS